MTLDEMIQANMVGIAQEEKEACIHCGNVWYSIHHRDGVCHKCQQLGKPGRTELAARKLTIRRVLAVGALFLAILFFYAILG